VRDVDKKRGTKRPGSARDAPPEPAFAGRAIAAPVGEQGQDKTNGPPAQGASVGQADVEGGEVFRGMDDYLDQMKAPLPPSGVTLVSPQDIKALKRFKADLEQLRHYKAGGEETDLLEYIRRHPVGKAAEKRTGRTVEELLSECNLIIGEVPYLASWIIHGTGKEDFIKAEDQFPVRLLVCFAWQLSTRPNQDKETDRALACVAGAIAHFHAGEKLDAENRRRKAAAAASALKRKRRGDKTRRKVVKMWRDLEDHEPHERAGIIASRLGITSGMARRHLKKAGVS